MLLLELLMPQRFYNLEVDIDQLLLLESSIVQCLNFQHTVLLLLNDEPYRNQQINISRHLYANCLQYAYKEMERIWKQWTLDRNTISRKVCFLAILGGLRGESKLWSSSNILCIVTIVSRFREPITCAQYFILVQTPTRRRSKQARYGWSGTYLLRYLT